MLYGRLTMPETGARPHVPALQRHVLRAVRALTSPPAPGRLPRVIDPLWSTREIAGPDRGHRARDGRRGHGGHSTRGTSGRATAPGSTCASGSTSRACATGVRTRSPRIPDRPDGLHLDHGEERRRGHGLAVSVRAPPARAASSPRRRRGRLRTSRSRLRSERSSSAPGSGVTPIMSMLRDLERREA
jgi:hypothetical protein